MLHLIFKPFPNLNSERLSLREQTIHDVEEVFIQRSHPEIQKYIHRVPAVNKDEALQFIHKIAEQQQKQQSITWAICLKGAEKMIGSICLWNIDEKHDSAELGYSLHPDYFKQGIMNEALGLVIDYGFTRMKFKRMDAFTNKHNTSSLNLLARNGFIRNKILENALEDQSELEYNQVFSLEFGMKK